MKNTIAATRPVPSTEATMDLNDSTPNAAASTMTPSTPTAAASVGVAMPKMIEPTTMNTTNPMGRMLVHTSFTFCAAVVGSTS